MTVADATPDLKGRPHDDRAFLGHPKGLGFLGFTEACERFSYYSMQTLLVLYMVNYLLAARAAWRRSSGSTGCSAHLSRHAGQPLASAIFGDLHLARLPDADPRRDHRRQVARPQDDPDPRRRADGDRPFPDGDRGGVPVRAPCAPARRRRCSRAISRRRSARSTARTTSAARWRSRSSISSSTSA